MHQNLFRHNHPEPKPSLPLSSCDLVFAKAKDRPRYPPVAIRSLSTFSSPENWGATSAPRPWVADSPAVIIRFYEEEMDLEEVLVVAGSRAFTISFAITRTSDDREPLQDLESYQTYLRMKFQVDWRQSHS